MGALAIAASRYRLPRKHQGQTVSETTSTTTVRFVIDVMDRRDERIPGVSARFLRMNRVCIGLNKNYLSR